MARIDEIIDMFEMAKCPEDYEKCPLYKYNDCDNYCPFTEAADMLKELKNNTTGSGKKKKRTSNK